MVASVFYPSIPAAEDELLTAALAAALFAGMALGLVKQVHLDSIDARRESVRDLADVQLFRRQMIEYLDALRVAAAEMVDVVNHPGGSACPQPNPST